MPAALREIIERSHPDGITDNSWAGMGRENICYCANCERKFREEKGSALPAEANWDDPAYRQWILWCYARRIEVWELNNRVTQAAGGKDCIWSGMNSGSVSSQARSFRDLREIATRGHILMLDHQLRDDDAGFQQNGDTGKRVHDLMAWDKLAPEKYGHASIGAGLLPACEQNSRGGVPMDDRRNGGRHSTIGNVMDAGAEDQHSGSGVGKSRIAFLPVGIDRRYGREHLTDHAHFARKSDPLVRRRFDSFFGGGPRISRLPSLPASVAHNPKMW
ncbi:MAG: hypothetical protein JNL98_34415 [Bryobacterales bacterium]|nr:hypothetical protein [Bryobacterales bacterium]